MFVFSEVTSLQNRARQRRMVKSLQYKMVSVFPQMITKVDSNIRRYRNRFCKRFAALG